MRLLICGSRNWTDEKFIYDRLKRSKGKIDVVIEGEARGADRLAAKAARKLGISVLPFPADWETYDRAAGFIRNRQMLREGNPDGGWAFSDDIEKSKGTKNMVQLLCENGLPTKIFKHKKRIVVHCLRSNYGVYIGRGRCPKTGESNALGNPFVIGKDGNRREVIEKYEHEYLRPRIEKDKVFREKIKNLHGKVLGCWCYPLPCHGDVLVKVAAELNTGKYE